MEEEKKKKPRRRLATGRCWAPVAPGKVPAPDATTKSKQAASPLNTARLNKFGNKRLMLYALPCVELQPLNRKSIVLLVSGSARGSIYTLSTKGCPGKPLRKYSGQERCGREEQGHTRAGGTTDQRDSPLPGIPRTTTTPLGHPGIRPHRLRPEATSPSHGEAASERRGGREDVTLRIPTRPAKGVNVSPQLPQADHLVCTWRCSSAGWDVPAFELGINACAQRSAVWCLSCHGQSRHRGSIPDERSRNVQLDHQASRGMSYDATRLSDVPSLDSTSVS